MGTTVGQGTVVANAITEIRQMLGEHKGNVYDAYREARAITSSDVCKYVDAFIQKYGRPAYHAVILELAGIARSAPKHVPA